MLFEEAEFSADRPAPDTEPTLNAPFPHSSHLPAHARARGEIRASFSAPGGRTSVARLHEAGGLRLRFPRPVQGCEAVLVNTGGGIAGGDRADLAFHAEPGAQVLVTTQAAEKVYRAQNVAADIRLSLRSDAGATLEWLPQETILFDGARLARRVDAEIAADASLTLLEATIFGRIAMGETRISGALSDRWRIRREGRLLFAEDLRLDGALADILDRPACGGGARATALLLHVAPDAEAHLDPVRECLSGAACQHGASAWDGMLAVRLLSPSPAAVRTAIVPLLHLLRGRPAPRVWQ